MTARDQMARYLDQAVKERMDWSRAHSAATDAELAVMEHGLREGWRLAVQVADLHQISFARSGKPQPHNHGA